MIMAIKKVSKKPDSFFKAAGESARKAMNGEIEVKDYSSHAITEDMTEEEIRKARNAGKRRMYAVLKAGGSINYPGGPAKLCEEIESWMYDD